MDKNQLRQHAKNIRAGISDEQRKRDESLLHEMIVERIYQHHLWGVYYPIGTEIKPPLDLQNLSLPVIRHDQSLEFYEWSEGEKLITREFNIPIPDTRHKNPVTPDVIFAPLLLCDLQGNRLGYGKGHYDRYLASLNKKPLLIGVCFDEQVYEGTLPAEDHDVRLDMIVTPKGWIEIK